MVHLWECQDRPPGILSPCFPMFSSYCKACRSSSSNARTAFFLIKTCLKSSRTCSRVLVPPCSSLHTDTANVQAGWRDKTRRDPRSRTRLESTEPLTRSFVINCVGLIEPVGYYSTTLMWPPSGVASFFLGFCRRISVLRCISSRIVSRT